METSLDTDVSVSTWGFFLMQGNIHLWEVRLPRKHHERGWGGLVALVWSQSGLVRDEGVGSDELGLTSNLPQALKKKIISFLKWVSISGLFLNYIIFCM